MLPSLVEMSFRSGPVLVQPQARNLRLPNARFLACKARRLEMTPDLTIYLGIAWSAPNAGWSSMWNAPTSPP